MPEPRGPGSAATDTMWVRRCVTCGRVDLRSAFGRPSMIEDRPWSCPRCGATGWQPQGLAMPGRLDTSRCPYRRGEG